MSGRAGKGKVRQGTQGSMERNKMVPGAARRKCNDIRRVTEERAGIPGGQRRGRQGRREGSGGKHVGLPGGQREGTCRGGREGNEGSI